MLHHYEFSRNTEKFYLLERNRLLLVMTLFERRTLLALAPALVLLEVAMLGLALRHGWARQKLRGWWWLMRHASWVREPPRLGAGASISLRRRPGLAVHRGRRPR